MNDSTAPTSATIEIQITNIGTFIKIPNTCLFITKEITNTNSNIKSQHHPQNNANPKLVLVAAFL